MSLLEMKKFQILMPRIRNNMIKRLSIPEFIKPLKGLCINSSTLIAPDRSGGLPYKRGNCFSMQTDDGNFNIVNFVCENMEHIIKEKKVKLPIKLQAISERQAVVNDERIPREWYSESFCEVCCPESLLPLPQRMKIWREEESGKRVNKGNGIISFTLGSEFFKYE
jgi:hypothetical protein